MSIPYTESSLVLRLPSIQWRKKSIRLIKLSSSSAEIVVNARSDCSQSSFVLSLGIDWCWQRFRFLHRCAIVLTSFVFFLLCKCLKVSTQTHNSTHLCDEINGDDCAGEILVWCRLCSRCGLTTHKPNAGPKSRLYTSEKKNNQRNRFAQAGNSAIVNDVDFRVIDKRKSMRWGVDWYALLSGFGFEDFEIAIIG